MIENINILGMHILHCPFLKPFIFAVSGQSFCIWFDLFSYGSYGFVLVFLQFSLSKYFGQESKNKP